MVFYNDEIYILGMDFRIHIYDAFGNYRRDFILLNNIQSRFRIWYSYGRYALFAIHNNKIYMCQRYNLNIYDINGKFIKTENIFKNVYYFAPSAILFHDNKMHILSTFIEDDGCPARCEVEDLFIHIIE